MKTSGGESQLNYIQFLMEREGYDNDDLYNIYDKEIGISRMTFQ